MRNEIFPILGIAALDQASKALAAGLPAGGKTLIPGVAALRYTENRGMAFSFLSGKPGWVAAVSLLAAAALWLWGRKQEMNRAARAGWLMMLGGAAGNLIDRVFRGFVPDLIELLFVRFAVFNVADCCVTLGCVLLAAGLLKGIKKQAGPEENSGIRPGG